MLLRGKMLTAVAAAVIGSAAVSGCSSESDAAPPPAATSAAATTSPTGSPTVSTAAPPPLPEAATTQDAEGATAFVHHWFDVANYGYETGDAEPLLSLSTAECTSCLDIKKKINKIHDAGQTVDGDALELVQAVSAPPQDGVVGVTTVFASGAADVVAADGQTTPQPRGENITVMAVLEWNGGRWIMRGLAE